MAWHLQNINKEKYKRGQLNNQIHICAAPIQFKPVSKLEAGWGGGGGEGKGRRRLSPLLSFLFPESLLAANSVQSY